MSGESMRKLEQLLLRPEADLFPVNTVTLTVRDRVVRALTNSTNGAFTITLPPVKEAAGLIFSIYMISRNGTDDITLEDNKGDAGYSDVTFNLAADQLILYSDGYTWHVLASSGI